MGNIYILKHKNIPVLEFSLNEDFELEEIREIFDKERLPFGAKYIDNEKAQHKQFSDWIENRGLPKSRSDLAYIKKDLKARNSIEISFGSYALNLSDQYWVHKVDSDLNREKLNFFDNKFNDIISFDIDGIFINNDEILISPNLTVDGSLRKKWVIRKEDRYLLKSGRYDEKQEPFNELIASNIMELFGIEHIKYAVIRNESDNMPLSICKCGINRETEYINAQYVIDMELKEGRSNYERYLNICLKNGIKNAKEKIDEMIAIDYLIGNTDRHTGNFGIIRDSNNLKWIKIMPIFDNGNSFCHDTNNIESIRNSKDTVCRWYFGNNYDKLELIDYPKWYDKEKSKNIADIVYNVLKQNENMKETKKQILAEIADIRTKEFEKVISKKPNRKI